MPKISVIVPVYNTEKYIKKCLDSIKNQTYKNLEIIVVNDGSEDNSEQIIKKWIKVNENVDIKYFKKVNGGLADARNFGVEKSSGDYLSFIDSDDYINENLYKELVEYLNIGIDVIKFKMQTVDEEGNIIEKISGSSFDICTGEEAYKKMCTLDKYLDPACIYIYRKEFFINNRFEYRLRYHEDFGLTSLIIVNAKTFVATDIYGYNYLQSSNSLTRDDNYNKNIARAYDVLKHYDNMIEEINKYNITNETKELVKKYYTNTVILKTSTLNSHDQKRYIKEIKKRKLYKNIKGDSIRQFFKRLILKINIRIYLKMR